MSHKIPPFDEFDVSELSEEDLSILQAFESMDTWQAQGEAQCQTNNQKKAPAVSQAPSRLEDEEMLLIFATEAEEDISSIHQILNRLVQHEPENLALFVTLKRAGHKLYGTAGAVGFPLITMIAAQVELLAEGVSRGTISACVGVEAISAATTVLEVCLQVITSAGQEPEATSLLANLEAVYQSLSIDLQQLEREQTAACQVDTRAENILQSNPSIYVDEQCFEYLFAYIEKLAKKRETTENALTQVTCALQELHIAQTRLQRLEPLIAKLCKNGNERDALQFALRDAIADLAITTTNVRSAFVHTSMIQQDYLDSITHLHKDTLCSVPHTHPHVCCLLVQAGDQHLLIPFQQIQRVGNGQQEQIDVRYSLQELLAFPGASPESTNQHLPLLLLNLEDGIVGGKTAGIVVDEILGEQECIVKPLAPYLQRSGIAGATIDGKGRVLLIVDLPALIRAAPRCAGSLAGTGQAQGTVPTAPVRRRVEGDRLSDRGKPNPYGDLS